MKSGAGFSNLICDLDDTLYSPGTGLMPAIGGAIGRFMVQELGIPVEAADRLRRRYYQVYGTSLRGLMVEYGTDPETYLDFVHRVPLTRFIQPNPALDEMLSRLPIKKAIFTNASREHAEQVLTILGIDRHFDTIIDVRQFDYLSKPHPLAYERVLQILDVPAQQCIFAEDSVRNLAPARKLGMFGVLVRDRNVFGPNGSDDADIHIDNILQLADAILPLL